MLSGVLNINKPANITSHDVVAKIRHNIKAAQQSVPKVGHTGTLDPLATGVLLIVIGPATRLIQFTHTWDKEYKTTIILGAISDTDDADGNISKLLPEKSQPYNKIQIQNTLQSFIGQIEQTPPAYSAIKIKGKKLYEHARAGERIQAPTRSVTISNIRIIAYQYPKLSLRISCSTGTYIRSIARDLGEHLGTGAYVSSLCRTRIGQFKLNESTDLNKLSTAYTKVIHNPTSLINHLPSTLLTSQNILDIRQGKKIKTKHSNLPSNQPIALYDKYHALIGIGTFDPLSHLLLPKINLST